MTDVAVFVCKHLHFDVFRCFEVLFDVHGIVAEVGFPLALRALERLRDLGLAPDDLHATTAAATFGFYRDGVAVLGTQFAHFVRLADKVRRAGDDRDAGILHHRPGFRLFAQRLHCVAWRPDPGDAVGSLDAASELSVFGEEAVPGMDRVGPGPLGNIEYRGLVEVRLACGCRADVVCVVGVLNVAGVAVGIAVDGDRFDTQLFTRSHHTDRDFAAVCDKDFLEH